MLNGELPGNGLGGVSAQRREFVFGTDGAGRLFGFGSRGNTASEIFSEKGTSGNAQVHVIGR